MQNSIRNAEPFNHQDIGKCEENAERSWRKEEKEERNATGKNASAGVRKR